MQAVYSGHVVARVPCGERLYQPTDGTYTFTQCDINGNILDGVALGEEIDTRLPPEPQLRAEPVQPVDAEDTRHRLLRRPTRVKPAVLAGFTPVRRNPQRRHHLVRVGIG